MENSNPDNFIASEAKQSSPSTTSSAVTGLDKSLYTRHSGLDPESSISTPPVIPAKAGRWSPKGEIHKIIPIGLLFLTIGIVLGYFIAIYLPVSKIPESINPQLKNCIPRPACLDATPRCMIPETPDMCPRTITPSISPIISELPSGSQIIKDELSRYKIVVPSDWKLIEHGSSFQNSNTIQAPDGSSLQIDILDSESSNLISYLAKLDEINKTSWEGKPGSKVISTTKSSLLGLPAIERVEEWLAPGFITVSTYTLANKTVYRFSVYPGSEDDYRKTIVFSNYQTILNTFEPLSPTSGFVCPTTDYVDCMPGPGAVKPQCSSEFISWASANCPNFQGAAL